MKGFRTVAIFAIIGLLGLVTALEAIDVKAFLLPLVCQADPAIALAVGSVPNECVSNVIKYVGYWTSGLSALGIGLRMITTSSIFKSFKE